MVVLDSVWCDRNLLKTKVSATNTGRVTFECNNSFVRMLIKIHVDPHRKVYNRKLGYTRSDAGKSSIRVLRLPTKHSAITDTIKGPKTK